jgi:serine/threonine protein kinase
MSQLLLRQMTSPARQAYSLAQALGWALDLASALEHLHLRRPAAVLHRDVKAANVMLVEEPGGALVAKLSDFGLHMVRAQAVGGAGVRLLLLSG